MRSELKTHRIPDCHMIETAGKMMELWYTSMGSFAGIFRIQYLPDTGTPEASGMAGGTTHDKNGNLYPASF